MAQLAAATPAALQGSSPVQWHATLPKTPTGHA